MKIALMIILAVITACGGSHGVRSTDTQSPIGYYADGDGVLLDAPPPSLYERCLARVRGYNAPQAENRCNTLMESMRKNKNPDRYGYGWYQ
ncbi:MAG: hypothetical protein RL141_630 [Candidatus Parcubacteria bacterium]|jgi:hypothetical protein